MLNPNLPEPELLKTVLEPLLEDFQYWFKRSRSLLEKERIGFLSIDEQENLLTRVIQAQEEVSTTQMLVKATNGTVGVEMAVLMPWHKLLTECWHIAMKFRMSASKTGDQGVSESN